MKKVFIQQNQSPGDILMLTSAVRDLYAAHNDKFLINVKTTAMPLWDNNPYLDRRVTKQNCDICIKAESQLIHKSNFTPYHFIHSFVQDLQQKLKVRIPLGKFQADIHLSAIEKSQPSLVKKITGQDKRFWIINAGHKLDFTNKMWNFDKYQQVVDILKDQVLFVQVGQKNITHMHAQLKNVINAVGLTNNPRDFVKLMYHASGVVGGVSFAHHLATMQVRKDRCLKSRGNVCVAGGRQPQTWESYINQAYIHRCGQYPCCDYGGCWMARINKLNDGNTLDSRICALSVKTSNGVKIPMCMQSITVQQVVDAVRRYQNAFHMFNQLVRAKQEDKQSVVDKYMQKQKRQHIQLLKQLYNLTQK